MVARCAIGNLPRMGLELIPLGRADVALAPPIVIPGGPLGTRIIVEVQGFTLSGDRINAKLKGVAAADWALVNADGGLGTLDVRVTLETDDGAAVFVQYTGRIDMAARTVYAAPLFETGDERYTWLNSIQAVAKGQLSEDFSQLVYELYELR